MCIRDRTNTAHLVAEDLDDARQQWTLTFARNRTDLGPAHAARLAAEEAAKYEPYVDPRYLDKHDHSVPVSRRRPEPIPTFSRRPVPAQASASKPGRLPGVGVECGPRLVDERRERLLPGR